MSDYTPTTEEVRDAYSGHDFDQAIAVAQFDRWLAEVERAAAEKAYDRGRLDERHDCNRFAEYRQGKITEEQYQRDARSRNPYRAALGLTAEQEGENDGRV